jgi:hypothetical protein
MCAVGSKIAMAHDMSFLIGYILVDNDDGDISLGFG